MRGWEQTGRRYRLVHDVARDFAQGGPRALARRRPEIETEYGELGDFLRDVQRRYHKAAEARLDAVIESASADARAPVAAVLDEVAGIYPDLRLLLQEYADLPALAEGDARFRRTVRTAVGVDPAALAPVRPKHDEKGTNDGRKRLLAGIRPVCAWLY